MRFREWLLQEEILSRKGIEFSTPENIKLLSQYPKNKWASVISFKYSQALADYINGINDHPELNLLAVVHQLKQAGVEIRDISKETMSGDYLNLSKTENSAKRQASRMINKWIGSSLGCPNTFDKNGISSDPKWKEIIKKKMPTFTANDLKPNIGILWQPNINQPAVNKHDDENMNDKVLWHLASAFNLGSPQEMKKLIQDKATKAMQNASERGIIDPYSVEDCANKVINYIFNNLMKFDPDIEGHWPPKKLLQLMSQKIQITTRNKGATNKFSIAARRTQYNNQQLQTNFANSTQDTHRLEPDPLTLRNRMNKTIPVNPKTNISGSPSQQQHTDDELNTIFGYSKRA